MKVESLETDGVRAGGQVQGRFGASGALTYSEECPDGEEVEVLDFRFANPRA